MKTLAEAMEEILTNSVPANSGDDDDDEPPILLDDEELVKLLRDEVRKARFE